MPKCVLSVFVNWYSKLYSFHVFFGAEFFPRVLRLDVVNVRKVCYLLFCLTSMFMISLIDFVLPIVVVLFPMFFIGCVMYADDLILLSPTVSGLQKMYVKY